MSIRINWEPVVSEQALNKPSLCPGGRHDLIPQGWLLQIVLWEMAWVRTMRALQFWHIQKECARILNADGRLSLQTKTNRCFLQARRGQWYQLATEWLYGFVKGSTSVGPIRSPFMGPFCHHYGSKGGKLADIYRTSPLLLLVVKCHSATDALCWAFTWDANILAVCVHLRQSICIPSCHSPSLGPTEPLLKCSISD